MVNTQIDNKNLDSLQNKQIIIRALLWDFDLELDKLPVAELFLFPFLLESLNNGVSK